MRRGSVAPHAQLTEHRTYKHGAPSHAPRRADLGALSRSRNACAQLEREGVEDLLARKAAGLLLCAEALSESLVDQIPVSAGEGASEGVSGRCPMGCRVRAVCCCALEL